MILTLVVLLVTVIFFVIGRLRADIVALCALCVLLVAGVLTPGRGFFLAFPRMW